MLGRKQGKFEKLWCQGIPQLMSKGKPTYLRKTEFHDIASVALEIIMPFFTK